MGYIVLNDQEQWEEIEPRSYFKNKSKIEGKSYPAFWQLEESVRNEKFLEYGVHYFSEEPRPVYDSRYQKLNRTGYAQDANGDWFATWEVEDIVATEEMVRKEGARRLRIIASGYSDEERETWPQQVEEVRAFEEDPTLIPPLLNALATADGVTLSVMAATIRSKIDAYTAASGAILAAQRTLITMNPIPSDFKNDSYWPVFPA